jgi:hypothetical protein
MTDEISTNTAPETPKMKPRGKPFVHGDPRINRKGRPKSFDQLRNLAVLVAAEQDEGGITRVLEILRDMAKSKEPVKQTKFLEYAYGKVPDRVDLTSAGQALEIGVRQIDYRTGITPPSPGSTGDSKPSGEDKSPGDGETVG